jgi:hypothetical protein
MNTISEKGPSNAKQFAHFLARGAAVCILGLAVTTTPGFCLDGQKPLSDVRPAVTLNPTSYERAPDSSPGSGESAHLIDIKWTGVREIRAYPGTCSTIYGGCFMLCDFYGEPCTCVQPATGFSAPGRCY